MDLNALFPMWTVDVILVVTESDAIENIESNLADYREFIQDAWLPWSWLTPINIRTQVKFAPRKTVESWLQVFDPLDLGHRGNTDFLDIAANRHDKASFHMLIYTQSQDLHDSDSSHHEVPTWGVVYNQHANDPRAKRAFVSHAVQTFLTRILYHAVPTPPRFISKGLQHHASSLRLTRRVLEHLLCRYAFNRTLATLSSTEALSRQIADLAVPRSFGRLVHDAHDSLAQLGRAMYDKDKDEDRDKDKDRDRDRDRGIEGPYPTCRALLLSTQALETHADFWETPNIPADNKYAVYVSMFVPVVLPLLKGLRQLHRQHSLLLLKLPPDPSPLPTTAAAPSTPLS